MNLSDRSLTLAAGIGALTGIRSMSALSVVSSSLKTRPNSVQAGPAAFLASPLAAIGLRLAVAGEMVADKLPFVPPRTDLAPILGRVAFGALAGAVMAQSRNSAVLPAAFVGGIVAAASTTVATKARRFATEQIKLPNVAAGLLEDMVVVLGASRLHHALSR